MSLARKLKKPPHRRYPPRPEPRDPDGVFSTDVKRRFAALAERKAIQDWYMESLDSTQGQAYSERWHPTRRGGSRGGS